MKLLAVNLLLHAGDETSPWHDRARRWLEQTLSTEEAVALPWTVLLAFIRLTTRAAVFALPLTSDEAFDIIDGWLATP